MRKSENKRVKCNINVELFYLFHLNPFLFEHKIRIKLTISLSQRTKIAGSFIVHMIFMILFIVN